MFPRKIYPLYGTLKLCLAGRPKRGCLFLGAGLSGRTLLMAPELENCELTNVHKHGHSNNPAATPPGDARHQNFLRARLPPPGGFPAPGRRPPPGFSGLPEECLAAASLRVSLGRCLRAGAPRRRPGVEPGTHGCRIKWLNRSAASSSGNRQAGKRGMR